MRYLTLQLLLFPLVGLLVAKEADKNRFELPAVEIPDSIMRKHPLEAAGPSSVTGSDRIRLSQAMTSKTARAGGQVMLICDIDGKPVPRYRWLKDGAEVTGGWARFTVRVEQFGSTLKIYCLRRSDAGQYRCVASNRNGTLSTDAQLFVTGRDKDYGRGDSSCSPMGQCQTFASSVCSGYLNGRLVFVPSGNFQLNREQQLRRLHKMMRQVASETCVPSLMEAICRHSFPACESASNNHGIGARRRRQQVRRLCREDCKRLAFGKQCRGNFSRLNDSLGYYDSLSDNKAQFRQLLPDCDTLPPSGSACEGLATLSPGLHPDGCFIAVGSRSGRRCLPPDSRCRPDTGTGGRGFEPPRCFINATEAVETCREFNLCRTYEDSDQEAAGQEELALTRPSPSGAPFGGEGDDGAAGRRNLQQLPLAPIFGSLGGLTAMALLALLALLAGCRVRRQRRRTPQWRSASDKCRATAAAALKTDGWENSPLLQADHSMDIPLSRLRFGEELGDGSFGRAYRGELIGLHSATSLTPVVIRCLRAGADPATRQRFLAELRAQVEATAGDGGHPNLVRVLGASLRQTPWCTIAELTAGRDLHELLVAFAPATTTGQRVKGEPAYDCELMSELLSQHQMLHSAAQVACALDYLANRGFVHRDVAARNVQVDVGGGQLHCRLGDLGQCREAYSADYYRLQVSHGGVGGGGGSCGRLPIRWMPPEAILYGSCSQQSDAYSFGVLLWEIWSFGAQPYAGASNSAAIDLIRARRLLACPATCSARVYGLMLALWADPAAARLSSGAARDQLRLWHAEELQTQLSPPPVGGASSLSSASASSAWLMPPGGGVSSFFQ